MNIFIDARWTRLDRIDGVTRYGAELIRELAKLHPITMIIHDKRQLQQLPPDIPYITLNDPVSPEELHIAAKLNRLGVDVVFSPMQVMGQKGRRYKLVVTLHDLIYYQFKTPPTFLPPHVRLVWWLFHQAYWPQRHILDKADMVVTVSETSKELILEHKLTKRPVEVVYNAPAKMKVNRTKQPKKELVYMGTFMPYKNTEVLIKGLEFLPEYTLHLVSKITEDRKKELLAIAKNPDQLQFWNGISDDDYAALLGTSTALVTASKAEGFGLPLVEAMQSGTPVVCSDMPIFREIGRRAALYFNVDSPQGFASQVRKLEEPTMQKQCVQQGFEEAKRFSWQQSAKHLLEILKAV